MSVNCPTCGDEFSADRYMKSHHKQAHGESIAGYSHECEVCGDMFTANRKERKFCAPECKGTEQRGNDWGYLQESGERLDLTCDECGDEFTRLACYVDSETVFCDKSCRAKYHSRGERNPNWTGGSSDYKGDWSSKRRQALERANNTCEDPTCSRTECESGRSLHVHHIIPNKMTESEEEHKLDNLLVLCQEHHHEVEPSSFVKNAEVSV